MASLKSLYRQHQKVTLAAEDRDGIALAQTTAGAVAYVLSGVLSSGGTYTAADGGTSCHIGHQIGIYSGANISTVVFTVVGTDPDGLALTETITGVNAGQIESTNYYYTVTSVTPDGAVASNVEIGIVDEVATNRIPIEPRTGSYEVCMGVTVSGTLSLTAQYTVDDIYDSSVTPAYINDPTLVTKTANFASRLALLPSAVRLVSASYSSGATFTFHVLQNYAP